LEKGKEKTENGKSQPRLTPSFTILISNFGFPFSDFRFPVFSSLQQGVQHESVRQ
jgi:hypothetical protein